MGDPGRGFDRPDCRDALRELYGYLDGELTQERRSWIERHLDDCPPCGELGDFEAELRVVIARKCQETVPDGLRERIAERIRALLDEDPSVR